MGFWKEIIPHIKERTTMLVLGVLLLTFGLIKRFTGVDIVMAAGGTLVVVYGSWILFDAIKGWRKKSTLDSSEFNSRHQETMRKAQDALDRSRRKK